MKYQKDDLEKKKIDNMNFKKIYHYYASKDITKKMKKKYRHQGKISANHISNKKLI
jgi:hypothetical protein